jgi:hypothetical protein
MIYAAITATAEDIPKLYEPGWEWWTWLIAWITLTVAGLVTALALPMARTLLSHETGRAWRAPLAVVCILAGLAAAVFAWIGPGILMRHMDDGKGAFFVFLGCLTMAGLVWYAAGRLLDAVSDPFHDWDGSYSTWAGRIAAAPAVVIGAGTVFGGIAEVVTRVAASIPMGVAQFLGLAASVLLLGAFWVAAQILKRSS